MWPDGSITGALTSIKIFQSGIKIEKVGLKLNQILNKPSKVAKICAYNFTNWILTLDIQSIGITG